MKKNTCIRIFSIIMASVLLTGCGSKTPEAPELVEPMAISSSFKPVEYGSIGSSKVFYGVVVPADYCHYWKTSTSVSDIKVDVGDQVSAGQVLAVANVKEAKDTIAEYNRQIQYYQNEQSINEEIYQCQLGELICQKKSMIRLNDTDGVKDFEKQIDILTENHGFDLKLYALKIRIIRNSIAEQQELIEHSELKAKSDGYVTFIKDISVTDNANSMENIIIVSNYDNCHVELPEKTVDKLNMKIYDKFLTKVVNEDCELLEYPYTNAEIAMAQSKGTFPNVRLKFADPSKMPAVGMTVPVFLMQNVKEHVLVLGKNSIQQDDKGYFVYVKEGDSRDVRYVELGDFDDFNYELISGLNEGEFVYYAAGTVLPEHYAKVEVRIGNYELTGNTESYKPECCINKGYTSEVDGRVLENFVELNATVKKGDKILSINTNEGKAHLADLSNQMTKIKDRYDKNIKDLDKQLEKLTKEMVKYENEMAIIDVSANSIDEIEDPTLLSCQIDELEANKKMEELSYNFNMKTVQNEFDKASKNNNGSGVVTIYAESDGELANFIAVVGKNVKKGDRMFILKQPASDKIVMLNKNALSLNQKVTFTDEDGKAFAGYIIGNSGMRVADYNKPYIETIDNRVYISSCNITGNATRYYIKMDDESFYGYKGKGTATYTLTSIENSILVPIGSIYKEIDRVTKKQYWYVWKIVDGNLAKQYVELADENMDKEEVCVIKGLQPGDVVANECAFEEGSEETDASATDQTEGSGDTQNTEDPTTGDADSTADKADDSTDAGKEGTENTEKTGETENTEEGGQL